MYNWSPDETKPHYSTEPTEVSTEAGVMKHLSSTLEQEGVNIWSVGFERNKLWQGLETTHSSHYVIHQRLKKQHFC
jgi:hypothetical protein